MLISAITPKLNGSALNFSGAKPKLDAKLFQQLQAVGASERQGGFSRVRSGVISISLDNPKGKVPTLLTLGRTGYISDSSGLSKAETGLAKDETPEDAIKRFLALK
jgi:hypothetical protein